MTTKPFDYIEITEGPSAGEIFDACKYAYKRFAVRFSGTRTRNRVVCCEWIDLRVLGIRHFDNSGTYLALTVMSAPGTVGPQFIGTRDIQYNAKTRKGHMVLTP